MGCKRIFGATLSMGIAAERTYHGNDLGAVYSAESTTFRVWAPSAELVILRRYSTGSDTEDGASVLEELDMEKDIERNSEWNGVWKVTVSGDIADTYYTYLVNVDGKINETNDIYAKAAGVNGQRGMVVNLASTNPEGWDQDRHVLVDKQTDAMVWEVHVRDFSSSPDSGMENKGKYLAFTEKNTTVNGEGGLSTGVSYLKELGVNYVQLLPVFDYVNDETDESNLSYDWGYSPLNYQVPEGLYATDPYDGNVRIREFKQMVQSLHEEQIGVVMDVVFNHVGGDAYTSWFEYTVPGYYFRQDKKGKIADSGTDFGNETASEREMFRKYMIDTVVYWASEYHIDGFRFDLMGCHDVETMNRIREALDKLPGGEKILMYGEPWSAGSTNQVEGILMVNQENMKSLVPGIGAFNQPLGMHMNLENRWVRLAEQIPWDVFESKYAELFPNDTGNVAKPLRTALGSLIIQKKLCFSDRELVEQITENPYLQYFIGLPGYQEEPPFDASTLVLFRKRLSPEIIMEANDYILNQDDDKKDPPLILILYIHKQ